MREIATALGGVGLLIFVYLVVTNASGFGTVLSSITGLFTSSVSVLQGQGASGGTGWLGGVNPFART